MTKNQNDFLMSLDGKIVKNCEVIDKGNIGSDRRMIRARVDINKKLPRLMKIQNKNHST